MFLKKIFGVILLLMISLNQNVSAEKNDWFDRNFNFRSVRTVIVFNLTADSGTYYGSSIDMRNMQEAFIQYARENLKCNVLTEEQARLDLGYELGMDLQALARSNPQRARQIVEDNAYRIADAGVFANIDIWENNSYVKPAYTVWEKKKETHHYYDRYGNRHNETRYVQVPVTYPPQRIDVSTIQMTLQVYEARRREAIFTRKDMRDREEYRAQKGMFGRICRSFFEDFNRKLR